MSKLRGALVAVAVIFGGMTLVAGIKVLSGIDPGYTVYRPLLLYNTAMGAVYILAGLAGWRSLRWGTAGAMAIFALNALVLIGVITLYLSTTGVTAPDSVAAMTLRTGVWLGLLLGYRHLLRAASGGRPTTP